MSMFSVGISIFARDDCDSSSCISAVSCREEALLDRSLRLPIFVAQITRGGHLAMSRRRCHGNSRTAMLDGVAGQQHEVCPIIYLFRGEVREKRTTTFCLIFGAQTWERADQSGMVLSRT